jgi:hypothetical protein
MWAKLLSGSWRTDRQQVIDRTPAPAAHHIGGHFITTNRCALSDEQPVRRRLRPFIYRRCGLVCDLQTACESDCVGEVTRANGRELFVGAASIPQSRSNG